MVTDTQLIARKKILTNSGQLYETYDIDADLIGANQFAVHFTEMNCPVMDQYP